MSKLLSILALALVAPLMSLPADKMTALINAEWKNMSKVVILGGMLPDVVDVSKTESLVLADSILTVVNKKNDKNQQNQYAKILGYPSFVHIGTDSKGVSSMTVLCDATATAVTGAPATLGGVLVSQYGKAKNLVGLVGLLPFPIIVTKTGSTLTITDGLLELTGANDKGEKSRVLSVAGLARVDFAEDGTKGTSDVNGIFAARPKTGGLF